MQYPASLSYRNNPRMSLRDGRGEFPTNVRGPYEPASAVVHGEPVDLGDRRVSRHESSTGRRATYAIVDVSDDAMHCMRLSRMLERKLGEGFARDSGNVMSHIAASNGRSNWLFWRAFNVSTPGPNTYLVHALREGARRCGSVSDATYEILVEHYASQAMPRCVRVENVSSFNLDHQFVRVIMKDGSVVIHDQWINPEAFLQEDGRFGGADDLYVRSSWAPGEPTPTSWGDAMQQARAAGEIGDDELHPDWRPLFGANSSSDLMAYARRKLLRNESLDRTETDCLLTESQAAERGLGPDEKIAYHHRGRYYSNDVVTETSLRPESDAGSVRAFPEAHMQQAQWELDMEAAMHRRDTQAVVALLRRSEVREGFPERHDAMRLRASNELIRPPEAEELQLRQAAHQAVVGGDVAALKQLLTGDKLYMTGDGGAALLVAACRSGHPKTVNYLLKCGAAALRPDVTGCRPWQVAQQGAVAGLVAGSALKEAMAQRPIDRALLMTLMAGVHDESVRNKAADAIWTLDLQRAGERADSSEIARLLASGHPASMGRRREKAACALLCDAIEATPVNATVVAALMAGGLDINAKSSDRRTPLLTACRKADVEMVARLLDAGAVVDDAVWQGYSALGHACRAGLPDLVRLLLAAGASAKAKDSMGYSAVDLAREFQGLCPIDDPAHAERTRVIALLEEAEK